MSVSSPVIFVRLLLWLALCLPLAVVAQRSESAEGKEEQAVLVDAVTVSSRSRVDELRAVGSLRSNESVWLRPEVAGRIARIHLAEGEAVKAGTLLFELDDAVQAAELAQAEAALRLATANHARNVDLLARKFVSKSTVDSSRAELEVARATRALAAARRARTRIHAPFDGVLGLRKVSPGDYVREGDALVNLEQLDPLKLDFRVPELHLGQIRRGQAVRLSADAFPARSFEGVIEAIDPMLDEQGRALLLRARVDNSQGLLRPGLFMRVQLILAEHAEVLMLPEDALVPAPGRKQFVYVIDEDGSGLRARRVEVDSGAREQGLVEITRGLQAGDRVVTAGQLKLRDGRAVRLADAPAQD